jgi:hypothetical protein
MANTAVEDISRISLDSDASEELVSPCHRGGIKGSVHFSYLIKCLHMSGYDYCD